MHVRYMTEEILSREKMTQEIPEEIQRLKLAFERLGISQKEFANGLEVSESFISKLFSGVNKNISDRSLRGAQIAFNINVDWVKTGKGPMIAGIGDGDHISEERAYYKIDNEFEAMLSDLRRYYYRGNTTAQERMIILMTTIPRRATATPIRGNSATRILTITEAARTTAEAIIEGVINENNNCCPESHPYAFPCRRRPL